MRAQQLAKSALEVTVHVEYGQSLGECHDTLLRCKFNHNNLDLNNGLIIKGWAASRDGTCMQKDSAGVWNTVQLWTLAGLVVNQNQSAMFSSSNGIDQNNSQVIFKSFVSLLQRRGENIVGGQETRFETPVVARIDAEVCKCVCFYKWHGNFS